MKRHRIVHTTGFRYPGDVTTSYNEVRMLPVSSNGQLVLSAQLDIDPGSQQYGYIDYWGTRVTAFELLSAHRNLTLTATTLVEVSDRPHLRHGLAGVDPLSWQRLESLSHATSARVEQLRQTHRTEPPADVVELARRIAKEQPNPCQAAAEICQRIGESMEYMQGVTGVQSTAIEAWEKRRGVCQDITHIALGALRSVGIPARYVSGYLHPRRDAEIGETILGESHAWVEWFCGDWRGYDPTNLIEIGDRHVIVGRGRDYTDIAPLRGVYAGPGDSELFVRVEITREG